MVNELRSDTGSFSSQIKKTCRQRRQERQMKKDSQRPKKVKLKCKASIVCRGAAVCLHHRLSKRGIPKKGNSLCNVNDVDQDTALRTYGWKVRKVEGDRTPWSTLLQQDLIASCIPNNATKRTRLNMWARSSSSHCKMKPFHALTDPKASTTPVHYFDHIPKKFFWVRLV
jgi:hypothetical protein